MGAASFVSAEERLENISYPSINRKLTRSRLL